MVRNHFSFWEALAAAIIKYVVNISCGYIDIVSCMRVPKSVMLRSMHTAVLNTIEFHTCSYIHSKIKGCV